jgi:hypothetical protein
MLSKNDHINELTDHTRSKVIKCFKFEADKAKQKLKLPFCNKQKNSFSSN